MAITLVRRFALSGLFLAIIIRSSYSDALLVEKRALVIPSGLPGPWKYTACQSDLATQRTLAGAVTFDSAMTVESCIAFCDVRGFGFAGTEYSQECYCGDAISSGSTAASDSDCNMSCSGNSTEACGGPNRLSVYSNGKITPTENPGSAPWGSRGCYTDAAGARTLSARTSVTGGSAALTVSLCTAACQAGGFKYSGVEYSGECYCGNTIDNGGGPDPDGPALCNMVCNGNHTEFCGGPNRLNLYQIDATNSVSAANNGTTTSSPKCPGDDGKLYIAGNGQNYLLECFIDHQAGDLGTVYVNEYAGCAEACSTTATCAAFSWLPPGPQSPCYLKSSVGANNRNQNVWGAREVASISNTFTSQQVTSTSTGITSTSKVASSSKSNTTSAALGPTTAPVWSALGCYTDSPQMRALNQAGPVAGGPNNMTQDNCQASCRAAGFIFAGVEYSQECWCGSQISNANGPAPDGEIGCNMACAGNPDQFCGGPNRMNAFKFVIATSSSSAPLTTSSISTLASSSSSSVSLNTTSVSGSSSTSLSTISSSSNASSISSSPSTNLSTLASPTSLLLNSSLLISSTVSAAVNSSLSTSTSPSFTSFISSLRNFNTSSTDSSLTSSPSTVSSAILGSSTFNTSSTISPSVTSPSSNGALSASTTSASLNVTSVIPSAILATSTSSLVSTTSQSFNSSSAISSTSTSSRPSVTTSSSNSSSAIFTTTTTSLASAISTSTNGTISVSATSVSYNVTSTIPPAILITSIFSLASNSSSLVSGTSTSSLPSGNASSLYNSTAISNTLTSSLPSATALSFNSSSAIFNTSTSSISSVTAASFNSSSTTFNMSTSSLPSVTTSSLNSSSAIFNTSTSSIGSVSAASFSSSSAIFNSSTSSLPSVTASSLNSSSAIFNTPTSSIPSATPSSLNTLSATLNTSTSSLPSVTASSFSNSSMTFNTSTASLSSVIVPLSNSSSLASPASTQSPTTSAVVSSGTPSASASVTPAGFTYQGCYQDQYNGMGRSMQNQQNDDPAMTIESCYQKCGALGFTVAGMEYYTQCFCDNFLRNGVPSSPTTDCSTPCGGNSTEYCGGPNRLTVFSKGPLTILPVPAPQKQNLPGSWAYAGCITDNAAGSRTFPYQLVLSNNTATSCLTQCAAYGFPAGGMEYSEECYCGDPTDLALNSASFMPESDCGMPCNGNGSAICGGPNRISYYIWNSTTSLQVWNYPSGSAAGEYKFLIGGVVIPLMTQQNINGKVTFLEKFGTGAPNTTGAYELDLASIDHFDRAWRPMHVSTDIFCSAGLLLPDKAGRQINIGGWSDVSTYGIRLYTPDGSAGVWGKNDWQENDSAVALQNGRWYPSVMIMSNGSILVVGGENGSNGPPVPTLELLPPTGPVLFMEWLQRTDPYNLYPFLAVLPSGNIYVSYYNEARILDPKTFATIKTLCNMPGSVDKPSAGRTYPLEGTQMLLPQFAPYTDPLGVLICGGATIDGRALDNCISTYPEAPDANWVIERMPSRRVIACMTALPDGTYLLLNGAQQGVAGFGLASNPNLNAVLYDPTKPVNHRMSVMANTTVARLYHSEAILLLDGRVLVSGSDPLDTRYPEEYRVETFMPPYLLSGKPKPTFNITNKDWCYGQSVDFQITSGKASDIRVSLLGAVSSTHGNSMGQRTIFPSVSCSGSVCTVVAPPDSYKCPPGWFQMFVLDGPTPSVGVYVRIGGDPGQLGDWPTDPAFSPLPGV